MAGLIERQRLNPAQARTVSDRRLADARVLRDTKRNAHANGAMYLAGIAMELLLKALLLEEHAWLQRPAGDSSRRTKADRELYELCYVRHDLERLFERLTPLHTRLAGVQASARRGVPLLQSIKRVCAEWSIHIRYSTRQANIEDARTFLERVEELRPWLR